MHISLTKPQNDYPLLFVLYYSKTTLNDKTMNA